MIKLILLTLTGLALFASAYAQSGEQLTGVKGSVRISPAHPGPQQAGEPATGPFSGALVVLRNAKGADTARAVADTRGRFLLRAPPGHYQVEVDVQGASLPRCDAADAAVTHGRTTTVHLVCDSGMR